MTGNQEIAQALRAADWSDVSIGNKSILQMAAERLDVLPDADYTEMNAYLDGLAAIRGLFAPPEPDSPYANQWAAAMSDPLEIPHYVTLRVEQMAQEIAILQASLFAKVIGEGHPV